MTQSVSSLNNQIKSLLETTFLQVSVKGELSRITYHNSGHVYFTLKDENSAISCVMFRGNNAKLKFRLEEGMAVILHGSISVYTPRGSYQINVVSVEPDGEGALAVAYEQLKRKLQAKGYFSKKTPLPKSINHIAIVTSATGAALQDMLRVASKRWPLVKITIIDTIVQGSSCKDSLAKNIKTADEIGADVIIVGRGGGSIEDLWGFNEEIVADAIYQANTPIVSAVGHEIDYVISDYVADLRAPTPSAAMEMILPDKTEMLLRLDELRERLDNYLKRVFYTKEEMLKSLKEMYGSHSYEAKFELNLKELELLKRRYAQIIDTKLQNSTLLVENLTQELDFKTKQFLDIKQNRLTELEAKLKALDPSKNQKDGYAQIVKSGKITPLERLERDDIFELQTPNVVKKAKIL